MPVVEGDDDHQGEGDGRDECENDEGVEEGQVGAGCGRVWRKIRVDFGADRVTHT